VKQKPRRDSTYCEVLLPEEPAEPLAPKQADGSATVWKRGADAEAIMQLLAAEASRGKTQRETVELGQVDVKDVQSRSRAALRQSAPSSASMSSLPPRRRAAPARRASASPAEVPVHVRKRVSPDAPIHAKPQRADSAEVIKDGSIGCQARVRRSTLSGMGEEQLPLDPRAYSVGAASAPEAAASESDCASGTSASEDERGAYTFGSDCAAAADLLADASAEASADPSGDIGTDGEISEASVDAAAELSEDGAEVAMRATKAAAGTTEAVSIAAAAQDREATSGDGSPKPALVPALSIKRIRPLLDAAMDERAKAETQLKVGEKGSPGSSEGSPETGGAKAERKGSGRGRSWSGQDESSGESVVYRGRKTRKARPQGGTSPTPGGRRPSREPAPSPEELMRAAKRVQQDLKLMKSKSAGKSFLGMLRSSTSDSLVAMAERDTIPDAVTTTSAEPTAKECSKAHTLLSEAMATIARLQQEEANLAKRVEALERKEKELVSSCDILSGGSPGNARKKKKNRELTVNTSDIRICSRLGSGGSGAVVHSCIVDGWVCAMKQMSTKSKNDLEAFEREMNILYRLPPHPNIVKYLFHKTVNGKLCLFMTRHETTLQEEVDKRRKCDPRRRFSRSLVIDIAKQVMSGIAFLHKHQILHRDIKCDNIFCTFGASGEIEHAVVADFDTARKTGVTNVPQSTIGTVGFMAPEVFNMDNESGYSYGVDVFSFGMLLYSMMTLEEPYYDITNRFQVYRAILDNQPPLLGTAEVEVYGEGLVQMHRRCVQLDPLHRPSTAQVLEALDLLVEHR